jgi:host factor-I protein
LLLKGQDQAAQMVFKHAISTISPSREVVLPHREAEASA